MASVLKRGGRYYVQVKNAAGKWRREVTDARTKEEAKAIAAERALRNERVRKGLEVEPGDLSLTFGKLFTWWWEDHGSRLASFTKGGKAGTLRKHVLPKLQALALRELTAPALERVFDEMGREVSASTVNTTRAALRAIFSRAATRGVWAGPNPVATTERRKTHRRAFDFLTADEVPQLLAQLDARWRPLFATAIFTGARKGELAALQRDDVDLKAGIIHLRRSWERNVTKGGVDAVVAIAAPLRPFLEQRMAELAAAPEVGELLFPGADGKMMRRDVRLREVLRRALARSGVATGWVHVCRRWRPKRCGYQQRRDNDVAKPCPDCGFMLWPKPVHRRIRFHDLRATTATLLALSGAPLTIAQRVLRHADPAITANVYTRVLLEPQRAALDAMVPSMAPPPPAQLDQVAAAAVNAPAPMPDQHGPQVSQGPAQRARQAAHGAGKPPLALLDGGAPPARFERAASPFGAPPAELAPSRLFSHPITRGTSAIAGKRSEPVRTGLTRKPGGHGPSVAHDPPRMLSVRQVAEQLEVCTATVYALVERGELEHVRVSNAIRIEPDELARYRRAQARRGRR